MKDALVVLTDLMVYAIFPILLFAIWQVVQSYKASRALRKELRSLVRAAQNALYGSMVSLGESQSDAIAIEMAWERKDREMLTAYARLLWHVRSPFINVVVTTIREARKSGVKLGNLAPDTITAEQVMLFNEVSALTNSGESMSNPYAQPSKIALFAIANVEEADHIIAIAKRGVKTLAEVKILLSEMKSAPSRALAEGAL